LAEAVGGAHLPAHVAEVFTENGPRFGAFLLSFLVIGRLWLGHHRMVERVGAYDTTFVLVNFGWLLTIVFLPFATQLTASYSSHDRLAVLVYLGTMALSSIFLAVAAVLVWKRPALRREGVSERAAVPRAALLTAGALVLALVIGVAVPRINYFALLLLLLTGPADRLLGRWGAAEPLDPDAVQG
jgi:uncharacterized membrane protein